MMNGTKRGWPGPVTPLLDLSSWKVRKEYTPTGLRIFLNIMDVWNVSQEDARLLLGVSTRYYKQLRSGQERRILRPDQLHRIAYLIGIYKALQILYDKETANGFVHMPNSNHLFGGSTPLCYMIESGKSAMQKVHRFLNARAAATW